MYFMLILTVVFAVFTGLFLYNNIKGQVLYRRDRIANRTVALRYIKRSQRIFFGGIFIEVLLYILYMLLMTNS